MTTIFLLGAIDPAAIAWLCHRTAWPIDRHQPEPLICDVRGLDPADAAAIDALARLQLSACRAGRRIELHGACDELRDLLELTGLAGVLHEVAEPANGALRRSDARGPRR